MFWAKFQLRELASILFNLLETISEGAISPPLNPAQIFLSTKWLFACCFYERLLL